MLGIVKEHKVKELVWKQEPLEDSCVFVEGQRGHTVPIRETVSLGGSGEWGQRELEGPQSNQQQPAEYPLTYYGKVRRGEWITTVQQHLWTAWAPEPHDIITPRGPAQPGRRHQRNLKDPQTALLSGWKQTEQESSPFEPERKRGVQQPSGSLTGGRSQAALRSSEPEPFLFAAGLGSDHRRLSDRLWITEPDISQAPVLVWFCLLWKQPTAFFRGFGAWNKSLKRLAWQWPSKKTFDLQWKCFRKPFYVSLSSNPLLIYFKSVFSLWLCCFLEVFFFGPNQKTCVVF